MFKKILVELNSHLIAEHIFTLSQMDKKSPEQFRVLSQRTVDPAYERCVQIDFRTNCWSGSTRRRWMVAFPAPARVPSSSCSLMGSPDRLAYFRPWNRHRQPPCPSPCHQSRKSHIRSPRKRNCRCHRHSRLRIRQSSCRIHHHRNLNQGDNSLKCEQFCNGEKM